MQNSNSFRTPSVYITLPSKGQYWPEGSLDIKSPTGELAVQSMTVRDEMSLKTPDALMNGVAVVNVIQSCCPDIKDAWQVPSMDLDTILVAIRIATYGEQLEVKSLIPKVNEMQTVSINLNSVVDQIEKRPFTEDHQLSDSTVIKIKPMNYRGITDANIKNYEQARLAESIRKSSLNEDQKLAEIQKAFNNIANMTIDNMVNQIIAVKYKNEPIQDIKQFITEIPAKIANEIKEVLNSQKDIGTIPHQTVATPQEFVDKGAPQSYPQPITLDYANFFAYKS